MQVNSLVDTVHDVQDLLWVDKVAGALQTGRLCPWVSTFHPDKLPCQVDGSFYNGAYNAGLKVVFSDGTAWMVRFPRGGMVSTEHADEKVAMEVTALTLIRDKTTIPVPKVQAWGLAASNLLGLGPFIMMDFIEGVSLSKILNDPTAEKPTRLMREDISDKDIILTGLAVCHGRGAEAQSPVRPLTYKAHNILHVGGVDTFGDRSQGFATTTEYFQHVFGQDWKQLVQQPNSVFGLYDGKNNYKEFKRLQVLIPDLVNAKYNSCKFKLICDDLGLANLIVRSEEDLTVVGVVDLEWSYIGPAQLFGSPWWLLQDRPINPEWDCHLGDDPPKMAPRYFKYLEIFLRILEEEEAKMPGNEERELSSLIKWSQDSGAMWLHMILSNGFNDHRTFPFTHLRQHFGDDAWVKRTVDFSNSEEPEAFAVQKLSELDKHDKAVDKLEADKALVDSGDMKKEDFIARYLVDSDLTSLCSPFAVKTEIKNDEVLSEEVAV